MPRIALLRREQADDERGESRLAGAARTYDRKMLAVANDQVKAAHDGLGTLAVAERDATQSQRVAVRDRSRDFAHALARRRRVELGRLDDPRERDEEP